MSALSMYRQRFPIRFHIRRPILIKRIFALLLTTLFLADRNTVEGAGKDIEAGGDAIKDHGQKAQKLLNALCKCRISI
jgi:Predicted small secreted protein